MCKISILEWGKWMKGIRVGCDVLCYEFNVLLVKIFVILIVSEYFSPVMSMKKFFFVRCVVDFEVWRLFLVSL